MDFLPLIGGGVIVALLAITLIVAMMWRRIVPSDYVHIVQSKSRTTSYGMGQEYNGKKTGNTYFAVPAAIPLFGVQVKELPVSNFSETLNNYEGRDKDRVPFVLDLVAFFRIFDTNMAAQRVKSFEDLRTQIDFVLKGAARKILAGKDIHQVLTERATFGDEFTVEVTHQLKEWGVAPVKSLELMDVRDAQGSQVIAQIMAIKTTEIEKESRVKVAENKRLALVAETENNRTADLAKQDALLQVGQRTAEVDQQVGVSKETAKQVVAEQARETATKDMAVIAVKTQRQAEIDKAAGITKAEQDKETARLVAEAKLVTQQRDAEAVKAKAEGDAESTRVNGLAEGEAIIAKGTAEAEAAKLMEMAKVTPQIELNTAIGSNAGFMDLQVRLAKVAADQAIGVAQAAALEGAEIKVIANSSDASSALSGVAGLLSSKTGQGIASVMEGLAQTEMGANLIAAATSVAAKTTKSNGNGAAKN